MFSRFSVGGVDPVSSILKRSQKVVGVSESTWITVVSGTDEDSLYGSPEFLLPSKQKKKNKT